MAQEHVNPILRKLSKPDLPALEIARLLEKHVGSGTNASQCEHAVAALSRIHDEGTNAVTRVLARLLESDNDPCSTITAVIELLRNKE